MKVLKMMDLVTCINRHRVILATDSQKFKCYYLLEILSFTIITPIHYELVIRGNIPTKILDIENFL